MYIARREPQEIETGEATPSPLQRLPCPPDPQSRNSACHESNQSGPRVPSVPAQQELVISMVCWLSVFSNFLLIFFQISILILTLLLRLLLFYIGYGQGGMTNLLVYKWLHQEEPPFGPDGEDWTSAGDCRYWAGCTSWLGSGVRLQWGRDECTLCAAMRVRMNICVHQDCGRDCCLNIWPSLFQ